MPHVEDTIVAVSTAAGGAARAIVRLTGPGCHAAAGRVFDPGRPDAEPGRTHSGSVRLPGVHSPLPAELYLGRGPHTYTGQDTAELHTLGSPPLVELLVARLLDAGARPAERGEFTLRSFLAGKRDLAQAEAVLGVIEARDGDELRDAAGQLAGNVSRPLTAVRGDLLDLLADVEAGLDFADEEDIEFVDRADVLRRLAAGLAHLTLIQKQLDSRTVSGRPFRVALVGEPNAGKSSLFNALLGTAGAIVSDVPGTTRDYLVGRLDSDGPAVELIDTAGREAAGDAITSRAQELGGAAAAAADLRLWCVAAGTAPTPPAGGHLRVDTKVDLAGAGGGLRTSVKTGEGVDGLRALIGERARSAAPPALAPSQGRCRHHVEAGLRHLRAAHSAALFDDPAEVLAVELRAALGEVGAMAGAVYTDDLLGRVFSRFCIGK